MTEYPTLTALMAGREPGSVKVRRSEASPEEWFRPGCRDDDDDDTRWFGMNFTGVERLEADEGPWLIVSEDPPALDTLRLEIAARVLAGLFSTQTDSLPCALHEDHGGTWDRRHAYALAETDALIKEARK